ncbi:response regulator [Reichenbachiella ulvae]|uniref:Response regulator n=1 Tax=Reichenbachiella ulvae TaxID=2980104 RepID=A0ABT3D0H1_9BACT|nr:response regulator [Reichenbachiella ulvae]MCV9389448.1 response regulator [Reichenbachiella ulvae]
MRILIVDDSVYSIGLISLVIQKMGHQIVGEAKNGEEAVEMIQNLNPDIITLDNTLLDMKGIDVLKNLGSQFDKSNVILISGTDNPVTLGAYRLMGVTEFLTKPFQPTQLAEAIENISTSVAS